MNYSTRSHPDVISPMLKSEATLRTSRGLSLKTARNKYRDDVMISASEAALKDKSEPWFGEVAAAANKEAPGGVMQRPIKSGRNENDDVKHR